MKILCLSDQIDPLVYTNTIKDRFGDISIILGAGNLPMDYLDFIVSSLNKPLLFVFSNHDKNHFKDPGSGEMDSKLSYGAYFPPGARAILINSKVRFEEGLIFAGLGGSMQYKNLYTNFLMRIKIVKLIPGLLFNRIFRGRFLDILLTHAPPQGIHDKPDRCRRGFKSFLWFMRVFKPKYLIHGQIHLYDLSELRTTRYHNTLVINAYSHYVFDTEETL